MDEKTQTHFEKELERLKEGFDHWCNRHGKSESAEDTADLFWPFVSYVLNHPEHSAEKTKLINRFKAAMGMELRSWG